MVIRKMLYLYNYDFCNKSQSIELKIVVNFVEDKPYAKCD